MADYKNLQRENASLKEQLARALDSLQATAAEHTRLVEALRNLVESCSDSFGHEVAPLWTHLEDAQTTLNSCTTH